MTEMGLSARAHDKILRTARTIADLDESDGVKPHRLNEAMDVDLLVPWQDFQRIIAALQAVGFVHQNVAGVDLFLDGPQGSLRNAIHVLFAGEKVRPDCLLPAPEISESEAGPDFPVPTLEALVRMKLTSFRLKDQVQLLDLLEVGLIDASWCDRFPAALCARLRELIETRDRER